MQEKVRKNVEKNRLCATDMHIYATLRAPYRPQRPPHTDFARASYATYYSFVTHLPHLCLKLISKSHNRAQVKACFSALYHFIYVILPHC